MPVGAALPIFRQVGEALDHAHASGVLHRDLKPGNVMLTAAESEAKVLDFGLAAFLKDLDDTQSLSPGESPGAGSGSASFTVGDGGTPGFLAPEVVRGGPASVASDVYAFGVLVYVALVGRLPFVGSAEEQLAAHVNAAPPLPSSACPGLDPCLNAPLLSALAKDPQQRPGTARELVSRLEEAARGARRRNRRRRELRGA